MSEIEPFENELAEISREALPAEWKAGILDAAEAAGGEPVAEVKLFGPLMKVGLGLSAACWVLSAGLYWITPSGTNSQQLAERLGIEEEQLPLLAERFGFPIEGEVSLYLLNTNLNEE